MFLTNKNACRFGSSLSAALLCAALLSLPAAAHDRDDDDNDVTAPFTRAPNSDIRGRGRVTFDRRGVSAEAQLENLIPGDAYTIWFAYIDRPENCQVQGCSDPDFIGADPVGTFGRMDAVVAGRSGRASFYGNFRNLKLSHNSQVWLIVFGHGRASYDNRFLARQLLTPQDPILGAPGLGTLGDGAVGVGKGVIKLLIP